MLAGKYLVSKGYAILERNYRCKLGEVDIIAMDPKGAIVFVEVKTREQAAFGSPAEAVTPERCRRYVNVAKTYIVAKRIEDRDIRFDVIEVFGENNINHIEAAFDA